MKLVLLGPPGAGKGTLAERLSDNYKIPSISTGNLFRAEVAQETPLGKKVKEILDRGDLVPDDITVEIVRNRLSRKDASSGFLLDGFPRTISQAKSLSDMVTLDYVINLDVSDEEVIRRLSGRRMCPVCGTIYNIESMPPKVENICDQGHGELLTRDDDKIDAIKNRLALYKEQTEPLIEYYREKSLLVGINAGAAPARVFDLALNALKS